jgi:hypothetical protein
MSENQGIGTFVHEAHEMGTSALDLFSSPEQETALIYGKQLTLYPTSVLTSDGPVEFLIPSDSTDFTALNKTRLEGEIEVTKLDGSAIDDTAKLSIVNLFPQSLWKQMECSVNGTQIVDLSTPTYPYKSFIETHLTYPDDVKNVTLKSLGCYIKDDVGREEVKLTADIPNGDKCNSGFVKRKEFIKSSKKLCFSTILHIDFFQCHRLLLPGCEIKLKLIRADDNFSIISDGLEAKIKITNLWLKVRRITATPEINQKIETLLNSNPAMYPICKSVIKTHLLQKDTTNHHISQFLRGKLPRSFMLCFVNAKGYDSNKANNPFLFNHNNLNHLNVYINGEPIVGKDFKPNFSTEQFSREYAWFLDNIGIGTTGANGITKEEFKANTCFFPFDLSPDLCNGVYAHGPEDGSIDVDIGFSTANTENLYCMMFASYDEIVLIDKNKQVTIIPN